MTTMLLRLHPATGSPAQWLALLTAVLLLTSLATGALVAARGEAGRDFTQSAAGPAAVLLPWTAIAMQFLLPTGRRRAGVFVMTLPVSGRRLWVASLSAAVLIAGSTALVMIGALQIADLVLSLRLGRRLFGAGLLQLGLCLILPAASLAAVLLHLPKSELERWSMRGWLCPYALGAVIVPGSALYLFRGWPFPFAFASLACAGVLFFWGLRRQPEALALDVKARTPGEDSASRMPAWAWLTALRYTIGLPALSASMAITMAFGVLQAVLSNRYAEEDETGLFMTPMLVYIMLTWLAAAGRHLHRLGPLPLSQTRIAALLTMPPLLAAMIGYGLGFRLDPSGGQGLAVEFQREPGRRFPLQKSERDLLRLPAERLAIAWDGQAPQLRAPWGESHKPWQVRIWKGAIPVLYSPVSTAEAVTPEFAAWTIGNALEMVYGVRVPYERIRSAHIGVDDRGQPVLVRDLRDYVPAGTRPSSPLRWAVPPLTVAVCGTSYLLLAGILFGLRRADAGRWRRTTAAILVLIGLMVLYLIRAPLSFLGLTRGWILGGALSSLVRFGAEAIPGGPAVLWLLCAAALLLAFRFAAARLARAEILSELPRRFGF